MSRSRTGSGATSQQIVLRGQKSSNRPVGTGRWMVSSEDTIIDGIHSLLQLGHQALAAMVQVGMGPGGGVKELVGEASLSDVDDVKAQRKLMGGQVEVKLRGEKFSIDDGAGANAKGIAEAYASQRWSPLSARNCAELRLDVSFAPSGRSSCSAGRTVRWRRRCSAADACPSVPRRRPARGTVLQSRRPSRRARRRFCLRSGRDSPPAGWPVSRRRLPDR